MPGIIPPGFGIGQAQNGKAFPKRPGGHSRTPIPAFTAPQTHKGWAAFNGAVATSLPTSLRQARIIRRMALRGH